MDRRRFCLLLDENRCAYSHALGDATSAAAQKLGIQLEFLPVAWARSSEELADTDLEEILLRAGNADGLIMMSSVFSHGLKNLAQLAQLWWPRPASSIGYRLPLVPSVLVDNRGAMQAATRHLIADHGRKNILFIRGRADSQEATDRYFGFRQALRERQIISEAQRVLQGDFTGLSAVNALSRLPAGAIFDAVIASNDEMALAAMTDLERKGYRVPDDVAVIGFDDIPAASVARPPLTTMAQPFDALAESAIGLVLEQCQGLQVPALKEVPVNFVQRSSCGCSGRLGTSLASRRPLRI